MKISRLTKEQKEFFLDMDPLMMMDRLEFPNTFALIAIQQNETNGEDIPAGLMICSVHGKVLIIDWLCVSAQYRMQGIGEQLLINAFELAAQAGLENVCAYINQEYGRDAICQGEENYFKERLFHREQKLPGEWFTDLRTISSQPYFSRKGANLPQVISLRRLSVTMVRDGLASLAKMKETAMLYPMNGNADALDADLSFLLLDGEKICGGLLVQCVTRAVPQLRSDVLVRPTENILYPVLFSVKSEPEARALLLACVQAALEKYDPDTDVHIILKTNIYEKLCNYILPYDRTENKILIADVSEYTQQEQQDFA